MGQTTESNIRGIILMVLSMGAFAVADTLIKLAAGLVSPAQVMFLLLAGGLVLFSTMAKVQGARLRDRRVFAPVLLVRYLAEVVAMVGMVMALAHVPLSMVGAIIQATPLLVALGAVVFLGETVSWRRWSTIVLGFVGVLMIVQPGADGFDAASLWAVLSMIGLSVRDLTTRMTPSDMASASLAAYSAAAALPFSMAWIVLDGSTFLPPEADWLLLLSMIFFGSLGYLLLTASIRSTSLSVVAPFRYARLIFMVIAGVVVFGERPGLLMLAGAALIVGSGLYMMWREQLVSGQARRPQETD
ncbi:DMT family transporter [Roseibium sp. MMSF_3544]|uniref:DMT family transporter n=1 Tax=unclassified Roseibium TaxID=2629323 RepID=UPI00273D6AB5|nr:DMT family transporter [Roseibium sp. MMSF_3544]